MSNYSYSPSNKFGLKDSLISGDPAKKVIGADYDVEFNAISTAISTKLDSNNGIWSGSLAGPTLGATNASLDQITTIDIAASGQIEVSGTYPEIRWNETDSGVNRFSAVVNNGIWSLFTLDDSGNALVSHVTVSHASGAVTLKYGGAAAVTTSEYGAFTTGQHRVFNDPDNANSLCRRSYIENTFVAQDGVIDGGTY